MYKFFVLLTVVSSFAALLGLIKPSWVLPWSRKSSRFQAFITYSLVAIFTTVGFGTTLPSLDLGKLDASQPVDSTPKSVLKNDQLELVLENPKHYKAYPVELTGTVSTPSKTVGGITKFQFKPDSSATKDNLLIFLSNKQAVKPGDKISVKGSIGIKVTDDASPEMIGIVAESVNTQI